MALPDPVTVRPLAASEAPALVRCFERCYGASYVDPTFHDAAGVRRRIEKGELRSVVAVCGDEIVGHMGLTLRRPGDTTVDAGNTVVDPRFRNQQLAARLGLALGRRCRDDGFTAFHHYPTTAHPAVQKLAVRGGGIETGVMLDFVPAETEYRELDASGDGGPWSAVVVYQPIAPAEPRRAWLPPRHAPLLRWLLGRCGLERSFATPPPDATGATRLELQPLPRRGLLRLHVERAGRDLRASVEDAWARHETARVQVDLRLADPGVAAACEALREIGFFYAALLPDYRDGDVLRLQWLRDGQARRPDVATDDARRLLDYQQLDARRLPDPEADRP